MVAAGPGPRSAASGAGRASEQHDGSGGTQRASCGQHARTLPFFTEHPTTHLLERWHRRRAVDRGRRERIGESVGHDAQRIEQCVEPSGSECVRCEESGALGRRRRRDPTNSGRPRESRPNRQRVRALRPHAFAPSPGQSDDRASASRRSPTKRSVTRPRAPPVRSAGPPRHAERTSRGVRCEQSARGRSRMRKAAFRVAPAPSSAVRVSRRARQWLTTPKRRENTRLADLRRHCHLLASERSRDLGKATPSARREDGTSWCEVSEHHFSTRVLRSCAIRPPDSRQPLLKKLSNRASSAEARPRERGLRADFIGDSFA